MYTKDQKEILINNIKVNVYKSFKDFDNIKNVINDISIFLNISHWVHTYSVHIIDNKLKLICMTKWDNDNDVNTLVFDIKEIRRRLKLDKIVNNICTKLV